MHYILTEEEFNQGYELSKVWIEHNLSFKEACGKSRELNKQGWFTIINCIDDEIELYEIEVLVKTK